MNALMRLRSGFQVSKMMLVVGLGVGCVGQGPADNGVEAVTKEIQGGTLVGAGGIGYAVKIDQAMSDGKRLICTGAFITPHVVLTAAHCTRNYDYGPAITPTTDTVIRYGKDFASSQKIAGGEKVGWRELGSTDIGLYRVAQAVTLPVIPKLYRSCTTVNLVGGRVVVYGRMINAKQAPTAELYMSAERTVKAIANGVGANGNYVQIDSTTDAGDSGGPWVTSPDRIVAVTHTSAYGARFCDVAAEIETQVKDWGETLSFVEDSTQGGTDGGSPDQGGSSGRADAASRADGPVGGNDAGSAGGGAGAGGSAGRADTGGGTGGSAGRAGTSSSSMASGGTGGASGAVSQTSAGGSGGDTGSKGAGGNADGVSGSGVPGSAGSAGGGSGGSSPRSGNSQGGSRAESQASAAAGRRADSATTSASAASGCSCRTQGDGRHARPSATLVLFLGLASALALVGKGNRRGRCRDSTTPSGAAKAGPPDLQPEAASRLRTAARYLRRRSVLGSSVLK